jgi:chromosomal replication initiator protein
VEVNTDLWSQVKSNLTTRNDKNKLFQTWLGPVQLLRSEEIQGVNMLYLGVPSKMHHYWISNNIEGIASEISNLFKRPFNIQLVIQDALQNSLNPDSINILEDQLTKVESKLTPAQKANGEQKYSSPLIINKPKSDDVLNPDYTFQTFVVGKNNEFAHAATFNIAQNPGTGYNPLFICGPVGMGKTHLLIAAGNLIKEKYPHLRVMYVSVDRYINDCVASLRHGQMDKFRQKYRDSLDVLLVDDIQGLRRGESVQEEFFHTLNELFEKRKQVIVASDRIPREIAGLEDRIRSRLEWGLIANIQMPDLETRMAILRYKAERLGVKLTEDVINYIAKISKTSIRELEGNLNRLKMFADLQGLNIDVELAKKVLAIQEYENTATIDDIQKIVADYYKVRPQDLKGSSRIKSIVVPRQVCMYLIEKHLGKSLTDIGRAFGNKDHTTVINARERIKSQQLINPDLKRDVDELTVRIHNINGL